MQRMDQLTILKLGGSAITDKARECTPDIPAIQRIAETEFYLSQLTRIICASLLLRNKLPVPFHPMSFVIFDKGKVKRVMLDPIRRAMRAGLLPLLHGDLVFDESRG